MFVLVYLFFKYRIGDLKLIFCDLFLINFFLVDNIQMFITNFFDLYLQSSFFLIILKKIYLFSQNMVFIFSIKFFLCIAFLILIRGGTPRYRYDYLTKLGWLKFLSLIILIFFFSLIFFFLF